MKINRLSFIFGLSSTLMFYPYVTAQAQTPGVYIAGSWGAYSIKKSNLDENDDVLKAIVGLQFNDLFGLEGSWTDFDNTNNGGDRFEADGKGLAAVLSFPVSNASSLFVKGGQFWWDSDSFLRGTLNTRSGNDPFWGAGFKYGFNNHFALRLEAERYDVSDTHLNTYTVGAEFKF